MRRPACLAVPANLFGVPTSLCRFEYNLCFDVGGFGGHRDSATVCSNVNAVPRPLRRFTCDAIPSNRCAYDGGTDACRPAPGGPSHPGVDVACGLMNRAPAAVRGAACTPAPRPRYPTLLHPTTHCQPHCALRTAHCQGSTPGLIPPPKKSKKFDACLPPRLYNRTWSIATHRKLSIGMFSSLPLSLSPSLPPLLPPSQSRLLPCAPLHPSIHPSTPVSCFVCAISRHVGPQQPLPLLEPRPELHWLVADEVDHRTARLWKLLRAGRPHPQEQPSTGNPF